MALLRKSVLITGCSAGGIGAALAEVFHEKGYHVFATARNPSKIPQALSSSANVTALKLDVLSSESIAAAAENVKRETGGKLDVLINNSGGGYYAAALDTSIEEAKKLYDLHVWAPLSILQAFAPQLIEAKGCLVNNSSISAYIPMAFGGVNSSNEYLSRRYSFANYAARCLQWVESRPCRGQRNVALRAPTPRGSDYHPYYLRYEDPILQ